MSSNDPWEKGHGIDLWSIPHFLFGILTGVLAPLLGISFLPMLALTAVLAIAWELFEKIINIRETLQNILFDVILAIAAYIITSYALILFTLQQTELVIVATAIGIIYAYTLISGWLAFRRRKREFMT